MFASKEKCPWSSLLDRSEGVPSCTQIALETVSLFRLPASSFLRRAFGSLRGSFPSSLGSPHLRSPDEGRSPPQQRGRHQSEPRSSKNAGGRRDGKLRSAQHAFEAGAIRRLLSATRADVFLAAFSSLRGVLLGVSQETVFLSLVQGGRFRRIASNDPRRQTRAGRNRTRGTFAGRENTFGERTATRDNPVSFLGA